MQQYKGFICIFCNNLLLFNHVTWNSEHALWDRVNMCTHSRRSVMVRWCVFCHKKNTFVSWLKQLQAMKYCASESVALHDAAVDVNRRPGVWYCVTVGWKWRKKSDSVHFVWLLYVAKCLSQSKTCTCAHETLQGLLMPVSIESHIIIPRAPKPALDNSYF